MRTQLFFLLLLAGIHSGSAVECYSCNSIKNDKCLDPFDESLARAEDMKESCNASFTHCRKLAQTVAGEFRIYRSCATLKDAEKDRVYSATDYYKKSDFTCKGDYCNAASVQSPVHVTILFGVNLICFVVFSLKLA